MLDDNALVQLSRVTESAVSLLVNNETGAWIVAASSLTEAARHDVTNDGVNAAAVSWGNESYASKVVTLDSHATSEIVAVLGIPLSDIMAPFNELQRTLIALAIISFFLSAIGIAYQTVRLVGPINKLAYYDSVTGLGNRSLFVAKLGAALDFTRKANVPTTVIFLDLDRFKQVNDTLGHDYGDRV